MKQHQITVEEKDHGARLDVLLATVFSSAYSRSQIKKMIQGSEVSVNDKKVAAHYRVKAGDAVEMVTREKSEDETRAENIPLEIIFEDEDFVLVNKPPGMVVHPACGNPHHTLVNALLYHFKTLSHLNGPVRPGIIHRLDKDTSGIMLVAKNDFAHAFLAKQFKNQTIERFYRVVVRGTVQHDEGICEEPVGRAFLNRKKVMVKPAGGKEATTYYRVLERFEKTTLLDVRPHTGRTHQIRVHMRHLGHPVLGDLLYGVRSPWIERQAVHALGLGFTHPKSKQRVYFETKLPPDIDHLIQQLRREKVH